MKQTINVRSGNGFGQSIIFMVDVSSAYMTRVLASVHVLEKWRERGCAAVSLFVICFHCNVSNYLHELHTALLSEYSRSSGDGYRTARSYGKESLRFDGVGRDYCR